MQGIFGALVIVDGVTSICTTLSTRKILLTPNVRPGQVQGIFGALVIVDGVTSICTTLSTSKMLLMATVHPRQVRAPCCC